MMIRESKVLSALMFSDILTGLCFSFFISLIGLGGISIILSIFLALHFLTQSAH